MALQLLFQLMLILVSLQTLLLSPSSAALAADPYHPVIAKPNCTDTCGNVSLPFPFGIGPGCFLNEWYEIVCSQLNGTVSLPRLKKLDLQVLNISLPLYVPYRGIHTPSSMVVQFPVTFSNSSCGRRRRQNHRHVTLDKSPFAFSETDNIFLAFGCDVTAVLRTPNITSLTGCMTRCGGAKPKPKRYNACSGFGCCSSEILPSGLQSNRVDFLNNGNGAAHEDCRFASLVKKTWFEPYGTDLYSLRDRGYVPVVLEWGLLDSFLLTSLGVELDNTDEYDRFGSMVSSSFRCENTSYTNHNNMSFMRCGCIRGYSGNPYLLNGCQDIDECESEEAPCPRQNCKNRNGTYFCNQENDNGTPDPENLGYSNTDILWSIGMWFGILLAQLVAGVSFIRFYKSKKKKWKQIEIKRKLFKECVDRGIARQRAFSRDDNIQHGKLFSSTDLQRATNKYNKDMILGQGGQGTVYKGTMSDGTVVAVKKSSKEMDDGNLKQFINEVVILSLINHRNIVKLLGVCLDTDVPLLVYEFIPNGTLYHSLHHPKDDFRMTWDVRLKIAVELAGALSYMHSSTSIPIYHRDIKSTNILLDKKYRAKIADFGTSRTVSLDQTHATTLVQGTFGYLDPEYYRLCRFTDKSDVYSFGVVLAELLTGQKPIFTLGEGEHTSLATYFLHAMQESRLFDIIDKEVVEHASKEEIENVADLIRRCLHANGRNRPTMRQVASKLESLRGLPPADDHQVDGNSHEYMEEYFESEVSCDVTVTSDVCPLKRCPTW